jgi:hypothetical protein
MGCDCKWVVDLALGDFFARLLLAHFELAPAREGRRHQHVAGAQDHERHDHPFEAHEDDRVHLVSVVVARRSQSRFEVHQISI